MTSTLEPEVGKARLRKEDARLITGRTRWTDNISLPGMLHLAVLRSPMAHAKIVKIDTSRAKEMPGVVAVYTATDLDPDSAIALPCAWPITPDMKHPRRPVLAADTVHFAGEGVAVVAAFMEPRSTVVDPTAPQLTIWSATQVPHILKTMSALVFGIPEHKLRVIAPDVGGGFGGKIGVVPEEAIAILTAQKLGWPVKW